MTILLMRPKEKIEISHQYMQQQGIETVGLALQCIKPDKSAADAFAGDMNTLSEPELKDHLVIVVSPNAAKGIRDIDGLFCKPLSWFAVGKSTANALVATQNNSPTVITPSEETSEGLLSLEQLQKVNGKQVSLIKGKHGRTLIENTLRARGARVNLYEVYARKRLTPELSTSPWRPEEIQLIVATSTEAMQIAWDTYKHSWLISTPWLVVSRRLMDFAAKLGIENVLCSNGATDQQLSDAIKQFLER
ncbi:MAG: hypothetical protein Alis3KO_34460 [Aliiglaciecola sp.]